MPHYIDTQILMSLSETELQALYQVLYAEFNQLNITSDGYTETKELLMRITHIRRSKKKMSLRPKPSF